MYFTDAAENELLASNKKNSPKAQQREVAVGIGYLLL